MLNETRVKTLGLMGLALLLLLLALSQTRCTNSAIADGDYCTYETATDYVIIFRPDRPCDEYHG